MRTIGFGIVGLGRIGKIHFDNINRHCKDANVVAVSNLNSRNKEWVNNRAEVKIYESFEKMVLDPLVNAVVISSPTAMHSKHIKTASQAGKAIFCEKPVDLSLDKVKELEHIIKINNVPFMVGFNRRFDNSILKIKKAIDKGIIGSPQIIRITSRDPDPPSIDYMKTSGGLFLDMAIHDFDMACYLNKQKVKTVYASGNVFGAPEIKKIGDIDTAVTTLTFENGSLATIDNSRKAAYGYDQRVEVFGNLGMSASKNQLPDNHYIANSDGIHTARPLGFFLERYADSFIAIIQEFIFCLLKQKKINNGIEAGLNALLIALAAKKSLNEKRAINLDEDF